MYPLAERHVRQSFIFLNDKLFQAFACIYNLDICFQVALTIGLLYITTFYSAELSQSSAGGIRAFGPISDLHYSVLTIITWTIELGSNLYFCNMLRGLYRWHTLSLSERGFFFLSFLNLWTLQFLFLDVIGFNYVYFHDAKSTDACQLTLFLTSWLHLLKILLVAFFCIFWHILSIMPLVSWGRRFLRYMYQPIENELRKRLVDHIPKGLECCICTNSMLKGEQVVFLDCAHYFHQECIAQWLYIRNRCPLCREKFVCEQTPLLFSHRV